MIMIKTIKYLIDNWKKFIINPKLKIIFVNPAQNEKWLICPFTHDKISDREAIELGINTLFQSVEEIR